MKLFGWVCAIVAAGVAGLVLLLAEGEPQNTASAAPQPVGVTRVDRDTDPRVSEALAAVLMRLDELNSRVEALENGARRDVGEFVQPAARAADDVRATSGAVTPQEWLRLYVASFEESDEGEELYRMHVRAELASLLAPVAAIVASPSYVEALRARLAELLDKPKFAANSRVVDALLAALLERDAPELSAAALESLSQIGGRVIARLEHAVWSIENNELRQSALRAIVRAEPRGPDTAIERLLPRARTVLDQVFLLSLLEGAPLESSLAAVRASTGSDVDVRLAAAEAVGKLHGDPVVELIRWWLGFERDERVRQALGAAEQSALKIPNYHAKRACGPPDAQNTHDDVGAWAAQLPDGGEQWIELRYAPPLRAERVVVHEIGAAGGVRRILGFDETGAQHELWRGVDASTSPGPAEFTFPTTSFRVERVRVVIETSARSWWEEVDAVQVDGPDGSAWAVDASASSNYGS